MERAAKGVVSTCAGGEDRANTGVQAEQTLEQVETEGKGTLVQVGFLGEQ